jgi:hypothetical protein
MEAWMSSTHLPCCRNVTHQLELSYIYQPTREAFKPFVHLALPLQPVVCRGFNREMMQHELHRSFVDRGTGSWPAFQISAQ